MALANYCPVAQAMACSVTLAREIALRNKIPHARVLRRLKLMTTFGDGSLRLGFLPTASSDRAQFRCSTMNSHQAQLDHHANRQRGLIKTGLLSS
jgi:hypothetical protein